MEDPRDYPSARDWYEDGAAQSTTEYEIDCVMWEDVCARLNMSDLVINTLTADLVEANASRQPTMEVRLVANNHNKTEETK